MEKKLIFDTPLASIYFIPEHSLIIIDYKDIKFIDEETLKKQALNSARFIQENGIKNVIYNTLKFQSVFSVDYQKWVVENINKKLLQILDKVAIIEPKNLITSLSFEQYLEETLKTPAKAKIAIFNEEEKALDWILKK